MEHIPDMDFYTLVQAAQKLNFTINEKRNTCLALEDAIINGELKAFYRNGQKFILHSDLLDYVKNGEDAKGRKGKSNLTKGKESNKTTEG